MTILDTISFTFLPTISATSSIEASELRLSQMHTKHFVNLGQAFPRERVTVTPIGAAHQFVVAGGC
jgi:hypothetical protein